MIDPKCSTEIEIVQRFFLIGLFFWGIVFPDLVRNSDAVWSLLLFSGYLTIDATPSYGVPCRLRIPNMEVTELYRSMILDWFKASIQESKYRLLLNSLTRGDIDTFSSLFFRIYDLIR